MNKKATAIVSFLTPIGWIIAFLAGDREGAKFHLNQSLVLVVFDLIVGITGKILGKLFLIGIFINIAVAILGLLLFILWIIGFIHAINDTEIPIPIIGGIQLLK